MSSVVDNWVNIVESAFGLLVAAVVEVDFAWIGRNSVALSYRQSQGSSWSNFLGGHWPGLLHLYFSVGVRLTCLTDTPLASEWL